MLFKLETRKYLAELSPFINKKDVRSIRKWCVKNRLPIYKDSSGEFVNETEFELIYNLPILSRIKENYGDNWHDYYEAYQNKELYRFLEVLPSSGTKKQHYKPKGKLASKFFDGSLK